MLFDVLVPVWLILPFTAELAFVRVEPDVNSKQLNFDNFNILRRPWLRKAINLGLHLKVTCF